MSRFAVVCLLAAVTGGLAGCSSDYSPNTYASNAVQQANKVEPAIVVGFRQVAISANGTVGAVSGGAAGGILGAQVGSGGMSAALGTVGGTAIGTILGNTLEHISGDTTGWEYIVRKPNNELLSLTQREPKPLPIGQKVLVITGSQARIVPDYSTPAEATPPEPEKPRAEAKPAPEPEARTDPKPDIRAEPLPPPSAQPEGGAPEAAPPASGPSASGPVRLAPAAEPPAAVPPPVAPLPLSGDAVRMAE
ncbi:outer membrane lipoprotein SlyB [Azospirillum agricola]|uniref:outer membrane lipoprotein n=1 Tax=Azospirillum agricola TaxID=1720247 RepID=UPI002D804C2A|nr:glycine zipper 2TM domain-containing protein [Azospirillum agricola]MBP2226893.1 outer membrane lipoprotein SlyB [Azospirillum agricola]